MSEIIINENDNFIELEEYTPQKIDEELTKFVEKARVKIKVVGVGGGGCNTINRLFEIIKGPQLIAVNTDAAHLLRTKAHYKVLIGKETTRGRGTGANPELGKKAARESEAELRKILKGAEMIFITAGLGGGTGTGAAPIIAEIARSLGAITVAIVTLPFSSEGPRRMKNAREGLAELEAVCDTVIIVPNDKLRELAPDVSMDAAFKMIDEILANAVKTVVEIAYKDQEINVDFNDLKTVMREGGVAMIGVGESNSENRAEEAIKKALKNPLLDVDLTGAKAALVLIEGNNVTVSEMNTIMSKLREKMDKEDANIIMGLSIEPELGDTIRIFLVVTGVKSTQIKGKPIVDEREGELERKIGIDFIE